MAFSQSSPSTTAIADSGHVARRLMHAFGTPNMVWPLDLCGWGRQNATHFVFGVASLDGREGAGTPDISRTPRLTLWAYHHSNSRLPHGTAYLNALKR